MLQWRHNQELEMQGHRLKPTGAQTVRDKMVKKQLRRQSDKLQRLAPADSSLDSAFKRLSE